MNKNYDPGFRSPKNVFTFNIHFNKVPRGSVSNSTIIGAMELEAGIARVLVTCKDSRALMSGGAFVTIKQNMAVWPEVNRQEIGYLEVSKEFTIIKREMR